MLLMLIMDVIHVLKGIYLMVGYVRYAIVDVMGVLGLLITVRVVNRVSIWYLAHA